VEGSGSLQIIPVPDPGGPNTYGSGSITHLLFLQVTSKVVKISELQEIFSEKVLQQSTGE
jgi:hypothetical protein